MSGSRTKRQRRIERVELADSTWADPDFGISIGPYRDRVQFRWVPDPDPTMALVGLGRYRELLAAAEEELVLVGREDGLSWEDLGIALGTTGEAVRRRHGAADKLRLEGVSADES